MKNIVLLIAYDGSEYHGFQRQENGISIQQVLEETIFKLTGEQVIVTGSGRTDAGVHAKGQVVNFISETTIPVERIPYALNSLLPRDIVVREALAAPMNFHTRFAAKQKTYEYRIYNHPFPDVFNRRYAWHVREKLDLSLMKEAADFLIGTHDFKAFCASGSAAKSTVRTVTNLEILAAEDEIKIRVKANGFLYNMVRIIVGTLVEAGKGKIPPEQVGEALTTGRRTLAGPTAPPHGLCLMQVEYENICFTNV